MKNRLMLSIVIFFLLFPAFLTNANQKSPKSITLHSFVVEDIFGDEYNLADLKGKKVMIVNTASKCGLTPQFEALEKLYQDYSGQDFIIIGFPANNFANQEPGTNEEIATFCQVNYGVTFPMMSKISVKGDDIHPLYQWLTQQSKNGVMDSEVTWNFQKYLIDEEGNLVKYFAPRHDPLSEEITGWISSK